jgi:hypothetical protein
MRTVLTAPLILAVASQTIAQPRDSRELIAAVRTAYEHNRASLSSNGVIRFQSTDGDAGPAESIEGIDASLKAHWPRRSPSQGLYSFNGDSRRYENVYSAEQLVSRRHKISETQHQSHISSQRLLTDGESTLLDHSGVSDDGKTLRYNPTLRAGTQDFFRLGEGIPLQLGNPDPLDYDLGACLMKAIEGRDGALVAEVDESAVLDGVAVVRIRAELPAHTNKLQITYWVDLKRGAIPVQTRILGFIEHRNGRVVLQFSNGDIRWVGRGWLPFRFSVAQGEVEAAGNVPRLFVREFVVSEADFDKPPDRREFALEFPTEEWVSDSDRLLNLGKRRVWRLDDFSPAARARAKRISLPAPGVEPGMPGTRQPWGRWPSMLVVAGIAVLVFAVWLWLRRGSSRG